MRRDDLLLTAVRATIRAGLATLEVYESELHVDYKEDRSPLTLADTRSHEIIAGSASEAHGHTGLERRG